MKLKKNKYLSNIILKSSAAHMHQTSLSHTFFALVNLVTELKKAKSDDDRTRVTETWKTSCMILDNSLPNTMDAIYAKPWKRGMTVEEAVRADMDALMKKVQNEEVRLERCKQHHATLVELLKPEDGGFVKPEDDGAAKRVKRERD